MGSESPGDSEQALTGPIAFCTAGLEPGSSTGVSSSPFPPSGSGALDRSGPGRGSIRVVARVPCGYRCRGIAVAQGGGGYGWRYLVGLYLGRRTCQRERDGRHPCPVHPWDEGREGDAVRGSLLTEKRWGQGAVRCGQPSLGKATVFRSPWGNCGYKVKGGHVFAGACVS